MLPKDPLRRPNHAGGVARLLGAALSLAAPVLGALVTLVPSQTSAAEDAGPPGPAPPGGPVRSAGWQPATPPAVDLLVLGTGPFQPEARVRAEVRVGWTGTADAWMLRPPQIDADPALEVVVGPQRSTVDGDRCLVTFQLDVRLPATGGSYGLGPATVLAVAPETGDDPIEYRSEAAALLVRAPGADPTPDPAVWVPAAAFLLLGAAAVTVRWLRRRSDPAGAGPLDTRSVLSGMLQRAREEWAAGRVDAFLGCLVGLDSGLDQVGAPRTQDVPGPAVLARTLERVKFGGGRLDPIEARAWLRAYEEAFERWSAGRPGRRTG